MEALTGRPPYMGGVVWCGTLWCGVGWCGVVWCGVVRCGVVGWGGVGWGGVGWGGVSFGVVWCGVVGWGGVGCGVGWEQRPHTAAVPYQNRGSPSRRMRALRDERELVIGAMQNSLLATVATCYLCECGGH